MHFDWNNKVILVAEDVGTNYLLIESALQKTGASLIWARNGQEALDIFMKRKDIDLILMDLRMPVKDGFLATREIRELNPDIPNHSPNILRHERRPGTMPQSRLQ